MMAGSFRGGMLSLAVFLVFLIGEIRAQGDNGGEFGDLTDFGLGSTPMDLVFVVDTSQFSNTTESLDNEIMVKSFLTSFLESADVDSGDIKIAMLTFSTHPEVVFDLNKYSKSTDIVDAIFTADFIPGERNTADALGRVRSQLLVRDRPDAPNFVLLLTSGKSNRNEYRTLQEAEALKYARANMFVVGYGLDKEDEEEINEIASKPTQENTFLMDSVDELDVVKDVVYRQIFTRAEQASNSPAAGSEMLDVAFLIHFSNTMKRDDFQRVIEFMKDTIQYAGIDDDKVRVGVALFRKRGILIFDFNSYYSKDEVKAGIDKINFNYRSKAASITAGLEIVKTSLLVDSAGVRRNVPNLVILITDSNADTEVSGTIQAAEKLKADGTAIFAVGINVTYPEELHGLTSSPEYAIMVNDTKHLKGLEYKIQEAFVGLRTDGFPLVIPALQTTTTTTSTTPPTTTTATTTVKNSDEADIVFLIHVSKKTKTKMFKKYLLKYLSTLAMRADYKKVKFGIVTYGKDAETIFDLQHFQNRKTIKKTFRKVPKTKRYKVADLTSALQYVEDSVFTPEKGDDPNIPNGIVMMSDQASSKLKEDRLADVAKSLKSNDISVFAVGIGDDPNLQKEIEILTGPEADTNSIMVNDYTDLAKDKKLTTSLAAAFKPFYLEELDVIFAVHVSHNVKISDIKKKLTPFINDLVSNMDVEAGGVRVSFVVFGSDARVEFDFKKNKKNKKLVKSIKKALKPKTLRTKGSDVVKAFNLIQTEVLLEKKGDRPDIPNLLIFVTDSSSSSDMTEIIKESSSMRRSGTSIFAIGVGDADMNEIEALANDPASENSFMGKKYDDFIKSAELREKLSKLKIFENLKVPTDGKTPKTTKPPTTTKPPKTTKLPKTTTKPPQTSPKLDTITTKPSKPPMTTTRKVEKVTKRQDPVTTIRIPTEKLTTRTIESTPSTTELPKFLTTPYSIPLSEATQADIVIAVHLTPKASPFDFGSVQEFLKELIENAEEAVENNDVQIGLMIYAADPEVIFHINQYHDVESMKKEIDGLNRNRMRSYRNDVSGALALGRQMLGTYFDGREGDVPSALILITDEPSNENVNLIEETKQGVDAEGIQIFTIGVNMNDKEELETLATVPENVMMVKRYGQLTGAAPELQKKILALAKKEKKVTTTLPTTTTTTTTETPTTTTEERFIELPPLISAEDQCGLKSDLVIIIDASTSVTQANYDKQLQFTKDLLRNSDIDSGAVRVGILIYSTEVQIQFHLDRYSTKAEVFAAIDKIPYIYGSTNTADAISTMHKTMFTQRNGDRPDVPNTCIVITDGVSNINSRKTIPNAEAARAGNIHIYAVGIGLRDTRELDGIASTPHTENSFNVQSFDELKGLDKKIFSALCPTKKETTTAVVPTKQPGCGLAEVDLVIIIDASTSVTAPNFQKMRDFCKDLVDYADVDSGSVRIGVLIYSTDVEIQFNLNEYKTTAEVKAAIDNIPYIYGSTNTADAIMTMHSRMFTRSNGDRPGVPNIGIVLTDGVSNINSRRTIPEANTARRKDIEVYAIGIGLTDTREVDAIANTPTDQFSFNVKKFEELAGLAETIFGGEGDGAGCGKPTTTTIAPKPDEKTCGLTKVDVVIILDASTSVTQVNFNKMLQFAKDIVDKANVDSGSVRIGCLIYSTEVEIQFYLDEYKTNEAIKAAIDKIPYIYGSTNSADALKVMHEKLFDQRRGDRSDVENVAFMITDGVSNINSRRTIPEAERAIGKGITVYAIGIGLTDTRELRGMASEPKDEYMFNVQRFDELTGLVETIFGGGEECVNEPPVADAGNDVSIQLPVDSVILDGTRSTDDVEVTEYQWIKKSGGRVTMLGEESAILNLANLEAGEYVFTLTVFDVDGQSDDDDVRVIVEEQDFPPTADAGDDIEIQLPDDTVTLNGDGSSDDIRIVRYSWEFVSGDDSSVTAEGMDSSSPTLSGLSEGVYNLKLTVYDELGQMDEDTVTINVKAQDFPPVADAGEDVLIQLPDDTVNLNGAGSTDDIEVVRYQWEFVSGDDRSVNARGMDTARPTLSGLKEGDYTLKLTVYDGLGQMDDDTVSINVKERDFPPVADAGEDTTIKLPTNEVKLDGTGSTDDVRIVDYTWRLQSGDGRSIRFDNTDNAETKVRGLNAGAYTFELTVADELGQTDVDTVTITVTDDPPIADAGEDMTVQYPTGTVSINGDQSSDDVGIVTYDWKLLSGDGSINTFDTDRANMGIRNAMPGDYVFELTVTDESGNQDTDQMRLTVLPEPTTTEEPCGLDKTDVIFVVDASTSVTEANFKKQLEFMKSIVEFADVDSGSVRFGALIYSTEVEIQFHLDSYRTKAEVLDAVDKIPYIYGSTNTADGLMTMRDTMFSFRRGDRSDAPNVAIVITDGVSNINSRRTIPEAEQTRDDGIHIYAVGIGLTDTRELNGIASVPASENAFAVNNFDELSGLGNKIFTASCAVVTTTTTTPAPTTTTTVITTTQPPMPTTTSCGLSKTDLVFILDASTSVTEANFQKMRDFLKDFLTNADINSGSVRVGINIYSTDVQIMFHLNEYQKEADVMAAIDRIPYIYGSTNTADALKVMRNEMFVASRGDRPDAPNVCVLLTDGISNINSRRTLPEAATTRDDNIHIYVIGIGLKDTREVEGIASPPISQNLFNVQDFDELVGLKQRMFSASCEAPSDEPPVANAGKDLTIELPDDTVMLSGERSTDDNGIVEYVWSQISGPRLNVAPTDNQYLELTGLKEGEYEIELKVVDAEGQSDTDTVSITVLPEPDLPPRADAGDDQTIRLPTDSVVLDGRRSSDDKGIVEYDWELTSPRDRSVRLRGDNTQKLTADNLKEGSYVFTLTVKDKKGQSDSDSARITVLPAPDEPPIANAGQDYEIQLPTDSVILDGSKSTDDIGITSYRWTLTSGNTRGVRMSGERTDTLTLDNLQAGEYVARLAVSDRSRQTSADEARIVVKEAPLRTSGYDVIFILDSSVSPSQFSWMNNYARNVIREMSIDDGEFRVGYLTYSHGAYRQFDLNDNDNKADVLAAIDRVDYKPGSKNTASAFKYARSRMFTPQNGDRDFAENYIIHLTGGGPSNNPFDSATEACTLQRNNVGMFAVGFGEIPDKSELDAHSSLPTSDYEMEIRAESEMGEKPGLMLYQLKNGSPRSSPCPTEAPTTTGAPGVCSASGDIVFILDSSGSVGQDNFYRVLNFTYATIDGLDIDNGRFRVGVTTFSDTSRLDFNLNEFHDKTDMEAALKRVVYMYGNTHTAHALRRARLEMFTMTAGDRPDVPNVIVIITDGQSNVNHELTIPEARALKAAGVTIITVAVGFTSETSELIGLTSPPVSENLIYVQNYESLNQLKNQLISPLCTDSNLCRKKPCQNGGVCMDGIRSFVCLCPDDFFGDTCSKQCGEPADVVIVLDSSNTVGEYNFGRLKEYAEHLVREMNKDSCDVNIGFLKYSSAAMVQVNLGMYADTETNVRALDQISYTRGRANMAAAFRALRTQMFNGQNGDRTGARNIAYFLTDGTNDVNADRTEPEAELTISSGVRIIPIGINLRERFEVDNIAGNQGLKVIEIRDESNLLENTDTILQPLFEGNDFCKENPCSNGGKCMNEPFGYTCDCPVGYTGDTCQKRCTAKGDVVFAVDTSRYVTRSELKKVRRFLRSVVKRMRFKRNEFSVGMVQFTDWAKVTLDFNEGRSKKAVRSSIAGLRVHGGDPEPATALAKANYRIFSSNGADREKPDYLILVTKSMRGEEEILKEANKLKLRGTRVLGVGLGLTDKEQEYMESTVSMPYRETAMFATDAKELADIADRVVEYMCDDEDLCAESPCRNGGVCRSLGGDFYCECGIGYAGKFCENRCEARADIVFLLDSSGSVGHIDFRRVKQFVHNMVSDLQIGRDKTRVGLVTYSSNSRHGFFMSKYYNLYELQNAIAGIGYEYGDTNTAAGLRLVRERYFGGANGDRQNIQNFLIIVTDGVSNINPDETITEAKMLKDEGVHIYAVGIGNFDHYEINSIASPPAAQNAFILSDYTALGNISSSIVKKTCRDPSVCEENPCRNGGLCVPGINGPFCECRVGYRGDNCQDSCVTVKDIYFLMDSSDSVGAKNYQTALNFIASIAEEFSGEGSYNRFSLMTFSDDVQIVFSLGRYTRLPVLMNAIKFARYRPGKTNTAAAFRTVSEISVDALGDRNDAENIIFVITDGNGNVDEETTVDAAKALKDEGARIIPIAVNMNDYTEIEQIASNRNDIFKVSTFNDLESILDDIVVTTCRNGNEITTNG